MKYILLPFLLTCVTLYTGYSQSKSETIDFIHSYCGKGVGQVLNKVNKYGDYELRQVQINLSGSYEIYEWGTFLGEEETTTFSGYLKNLDPSSVRIEKTWGGNWIVLVDCTNNKECVAQVTVPSNRRDQSFRTCFGIFRTTTEANKVRDALKHLITLFGGKKSLF